MCSANDPYTRGSISDISKWRSTIIFADDMGGAFQLGVWKVT